MTRDEVPAAVTQILARAARWMPTEKQPFYDGVERTLQVFGVAVRDQLWALECLEPIREDMEKAVDGPIVITFYK